MLSNPDDFYWAPQRAAPKQRECPDCGAPLRKRTSDKQSALLRVFYCQCTNLACGATFRGHEEILYRMKVPLEPNPLVKLPVSPTQAHAAPFPADGSQPTKDRCPECGESVLKHCVATDDPACFIVYVHCRANACPWSMRGTVSLEHYPKKQCV